MPQQGTLGKRLKVMVQGMNRFYCYLTFVLCFAVLHIPKPLAPVLVSYGQDRGSELKCLISITAIGPLAILVSGYRQYFGGF